MSRGGPHSLPEGWDARAVMDCILPKGVENKGSIQQREYQPSGRFPVVDQGAALIAGYTDEQTVVYQQDLPLILFGDHTRVFKFLDFPFATGADGTKLLKPNREFVDAKFLYYALLELGIPSRGYNRHFKYLKEREVPCPSDKAEQRRIAAVLGKIQAAIELQQKIVTTLKELKAATMAKLFREGTRGERLKHTEIGEMPESWEVVRIEKLARISTGTTPATDDPSNYTGDIPFIKTAEIDNNILNFSRQNISREALERYSLRVYPAGTVFLAMYGQGKTRGRVSLLGISSTTTQNTAAIEPGEDLDSLYLWNYLLGQYERLRNTGNLGHLSHLNLGYVKALEIPLPPKHEQGQLGSVLSRLHSTIEVEEQKAGSLQTLFSSMLHLLMTGQVRVNGLNLEDVSQ